MKLNGYLAMILSLRSKPVKVIRQTFVPVCGLVLAMLLGLSWLGFPGFLTRWILSDINEGDYYVEAHNLRLDLRGGLKASDVAIYRKGVVGPPFFEARDMRVIFRFLERPRAGVSRVKGIQVKGGVIRADGGPAILVRDSGRKGAGRAAAESAGIMPEIRNLDVALKDFEVMGVYVDQLRAGVRVGVEGVRLSGLSGVVGRDMQRGAVDGNMVWTWDRKASGRLVTAFDPRALIPPGRSFYPGAATLLEQFSFSGTSPRLDVEFEWDMGPAWFVRARGRMQASRYAYRGAGIGFANITADYVCSNGVNRLRLDPFLIVAGGRQAEGQTEFDFKAGTAGFEVISTIDLATVLRLSGIKEQALEAWHLGDGTRLTARGRLDYRMSERSEITASVEGSRIGYSRLEAAEYGFRYSASGGTNQFTDVHGKVGNGSFSGLAVLVPSGTGVVWRVQTELIHVDMETLLAGLSPDPVWRTDGKVYGNIELENPGAGPNSGGLTGRGQMTLRSSHVFKLPLFAKLASELDRTIPGLDVINSCGDAHFTYEVRNGRLVIRDFQMDAGLVTVTAAGSCGLDGSLDFIVRVHLMKKSESIVRTITGLFAVEKGAEFALGGSLTAPRWAVTKRR